MNSWLQIVQILASIIVGIFFALTCFIGIFLLARRRGKVGDENSIRIKSLNDELSKAKKTALKEVLSEKEYTAWIKTSRKEEKKDLKKPDRPRIFVADFTGNLSADRVAGLREEITTILQLAHTGDEVVVKLESQGGMVHAYGLASAQLARLRDKQIPLTVCVDKVAASGGYMMACVANHIVASPFAIIGSIGVLASFPNFHKVLRKNEVDWMEFKGGDHKRTVTMFGEVTEQGVAKIQEQIAETHLLFKEFVKTNRPSVDIDSVATGEYWFGTQAKEKGLVDEISTSDQFLIDKTDRFQVFLISWQQKQTWQQKLFGTLQGNFANSVASTLPII